MPGGSFGDAQTGVDLALIRYLNAHQGPARYYVAGLQSTRVEPIIIQTGKPAIALGDFSGSDPIVSLPRLQRIIRSGQVRFFLLPSLGGGFLRIGGGFLQDVTGAPGIASGFGFGRDRGNALYDCRKLAK